jgi:hypothetical protein
MSDETETIKEVVTKSASGPKVIHVAGMGSSEDHSLADQIKAAKFLTSSTVARRVGGGIRFTKATAGGAV